MKNLPLVGAMQAMLEGWQGDLPPAWRAALADALLGFTEMDRALTLEFWEPIFPARAGRVFPGAPKGAHMFRAFDGIAPEAVRVVVLGQDPYPSPDFATGRAFEAGNVARWRELEKMFSVSVRTYMQLIATARTGDTRYVASTKSWTLLIDDIEAGRIDIEPAATIADRWVGEGALLLNSALTLSRFKVEGDPHQLRGHLPLWRPLMVAVLKLLTARGNVVFMGFGDQAAEALRLAGIDAGAMPRPGGYGCILREHPALGDKVLELENPFTACNRMLQAMGVGPVAW